MPEIANYSHVARRPMGTTRRTLIWIEDRHFHGWRCSECVWVFKASGPPTGNSLQEMLENYKRLRDREFAAHICTEPSRRTYVKA